MRDILDAQQEFKGSLKLLHGIELGQATHMPKEAAELLRKYPYDVVLGSVHAVRGIIDFSETDIKSLSGNERIRLWEQYLGELIDTVKWGDFEILTHITYPKRYYLYNGVKDFPDIKNRGREYFEPVLKAVIDSGLTLECNTSGLRQIMGECLPNADLFGFYYELGGRDVSIGSDAHHARHIGAGIKEGVEMLKAIGFTHIATFEKRKKDYKKL